MTWLLHDLVTDVIIKLVHRSSREQLADIMTKPLKLEQFLKMREKFGNSCEFQSSFLCNTILLVDITQRDCATERIILCM
ncbi:hypothetical protein DCAR_0518881 [Daucus carota subsp. sativus]|uniref:Uncharacterized protein n=1 Tax=Daucus carota subsp. sativus TaxID=79200 RepID=A0AAF0X3E0_DAUCS|nr:hypothetical protein DCAR_0518881 [Daucus carota subsp. sativus]